MERRKHYRWGQKKHEPSQQIEMVNPLYKEKGQFWLQWLEKTKIVDNNKTCHYHLIVYIPWLLSDYTNTYISVC